MRGLPYCGKSHTARQLATEGGVICETDDYFFSHVGDDPTRYDYDKDLLATAREWNFRRFTKAVDEGVSPVVVDRGCGLNVGNPAIRPLRHRCWLPGPQLKEPESEWWQEIRKLLKDKDANRELLYQWADRLAEQSKTNHRVPASTIRRRMDKWKLDLTIEDILIYIPQSNDNPK